MLQTHIVLLLRRTYDTCLLTPATVCGLLKREKEKEKEIDVGENGLNSIEFSFSGSATYSSRLYSQLA